MLWGWHAAPFPTPQTAVLRRYGGATGRAMTGRSGRFDRCPESVHETWSISGRRHDFGVSNRRMGDRTPSCAAGRRGWLRDPVISDTEKPCPQAFLLQVSCDNKNLDMQLSGCARFSMPRTSPPARFGCALVAISSGSGTTPMAQPCLTPARPRRNTHRSGPDTRGPGHGGLRA